jgi:predicted amino acid racemase
VASPYVTIDLDKIERNARTIVGLCAAHGMEVAGVTKCTCGHPEVAKAMLCGGVASIADSRLENMHRLHAAGIDAADTLLRLPALSAVDAVVASVDVSLNSELAVLESLSTAARCLGRRHGVIVMVDLGDLREGVWPDELVPFVEQAARLPGIRLRGIGTNLACFGGVMPSVENMGRLAELATVVEAQLGRSLEWVSGANSSALPLIASRRMPARINHARIGEAILPGRETIRRSPWPDTFQDAFVIHAEVLEVRRRPSLPLGERGEEAFGGQPTFEDRGAMTRALLNIGHEDVHIDGIAPLEPGVDILGASSGYLVMDVTRAERGIRVGDEMDFSLNYAALLAAMTSEYVKRRPLRGGLTALTVIG